MSSDWVQKTRQPGIKTADSPGDATVIRVEKRTLILDDISSWPEGVVSRLADKVSKIRDEILAEIEYDFLPSIERILRRRLPPPKDEYEMMHSFIEQEISGCCLRSYHCCRLEEEDAQKIRNMGLKRLDPTERVEALIRLAPKKPELNAIIQDLRQLLDDPVKLRELATNRRYVCLVPAKSAIDSGCDPLFDHWGGEFVRRVLEEIDQSLCRHLKSFGRPYVVAADVPIAWLAPWKDVASLMIRLFVIDRFKDDIRPGFFDIFVERHIPAHFIVDVSPHS